MIASRQVEIPFYRGVDRQRGKGFGACKERIGSLSSQCLRKSLVPAEKRVGGGRMDFSAPKFAEAVTGRINFKKTTKSGKTSSRNQLCSGSGIKSAGKFLPKNMQNAHLVARRLFKNTIFSQY